MTADDEAVASLDEVEREALYEVELGVENLERAHGHLIAFHHTVGRAMNHLTAAESLLRRAGHESLADGLRDDLLSRGVIADRGGGQGMWSYEVLEAFEEGFLEDFLAFGDAVSEDVAGGRRHVRERALKRTYTDRPDGE